MASIFDMLNRQLGGDAIQQISSQLGVDAETAGNAVDDVAGLLGKFFRR